MHWAFDKGFFTLTKDYKVLVHPRIESDWLRSYDGMHLSLPDNPFFQPATESIEYHNKNIYGLFLTSGGTQ
jgi:predicted restriction endonuclease